MSTDTDVDHPDELAVSVVVDEQIPMALTGADRVEAVRRLALKDISTRRIAELTGSHPDSISRIRRELGLPASPRPDGNWYRLYLARKPI